MADDQRDSPEAGGKRRRPATIDLKATEVAAEPATSSEPAEKTEETATAAAAEPAAPAPAPPPSKDWLKVASSTSPTGSGSGWRFAASGAIGAAIVLLLFLAAWAAGLIGPADEQSAAIASRINGLEKQVRDVAARPPVPGTAAADPRPLADLTARLAAAEGALGRLADIDARLGKAEQAAAAPRPAASPDPALANRIAALETAAREAKARADAAFEAAQKNTAAPAAQAADRKEIEALAARVTALEQAVKSADTRITAAAGPDKAGRLAFAAGALRGRAERGEPFAAELTAVKPLADAKMTAPLEPFAATGIPRAAALARELSQLSGAMLAVAGANPQGGIVERLQANAERLVRIRPISEAPGDDPTTVIGRADVKATHGDLAGAAADIASLPPAVRAPAENWIGRVRAREAALAAANALADNAIGALSKTGP